jgi:hypothetical protein
VPPPSRTTRPKPEVKKQLMSRFGTWPSLTVQHRANFKCGVTVGIYEDDGDHAAWLGVWVWAPPKRVAERDTIRELGKKLPSGWEPDPGWELLGAYRRLLDFAAHEQGAGWLIERVGELVQVGMQFNCSRARALWLPARSRPNRLSRIAAAVRGCSSSVPSFPSTRLCQSGAGRAANAAWQVPSGYTEPETRPRRAVKIAADLRRGRTAGRNRR